MCDLKKQIVVGSVFSTTVGDPPTFKEEGPAPKETLIKTGCGYA